MSHPKPTKQDLEMTGQVACLEEVIAKYGRSDDGGKYIALVTTIATVLALARTRGKNPEPKHFEWWQADQMAAGLGSTFERLENLDPTRAHHLHKDGPLDEEQFREARMLQVRLGAAGDIHRVKGLFTPTAHIHNAVELAATDLLYPYGFRPALAGDTGKCEPSEDNPDCDPTQNLWVRFIGLETEPFRPARPPLRGAKHKVPKPG